MAEGALLERRPAAARQDRVVRHGPWPGQALDDGEVRPVSLAQETAFANGEQLGHRVAGLGHHLGHAQHPFADQLQRRRQGVLHQRQA